MSAADVELVLKMENEAPPDWAQTFADEEALARWKAAMTPYLHPDFEYIVPWGPGGTTTHRGVDAWIDVWIDIFDAFDRLERINDPRHLVDVGDGRVLAFWEANAISNQGIEIDASVWAIHTVRDDLILSIEFFPNPGDAFAAAGLDPETAKRT